MIELSVDGMVELIEQERTFLNGCFYGLFVNNITPDRFTVEGDFDECVDTGYVATGRQGPSFAAAVLNGDDQGELLGPDLTWTLDHDSGDYTIFGYFVADSASGGTLIYSERAASPFLVTAPGQQYRVTPRKVMDTLA